MRIERLLSSISFNPTPGVYDSGGAGAGAGELDATRMLAQAQRGAAARVEAAQDGQTRALVTRAGALATLGREAANFGGTLIAVVQRQQQREAARSHATAVENHAVDLERQKSAILTRAAEAAGPDGSGLAAGAGDLFDQLLADRLDGISDPAVRRDLEARVAAGRPLQQSEAQLLETRRRNTFHGDELNKRVADRALRAVASTSSAEQTMLLNAISADIRTQVGSGALSPAQGDIRLRAARDRVRNGTFEAWSRQDPGEALTLLDRGAFDHLFDDDDEKADARSFLEDVRTGLASDAVERAVLAQIAEVEIRQREFIGRGDPELRERIAMSGDRERLAAYDKAALAAEQSHDFSLAIRFRNADDRLAQFDIAMATAGDDEAARAGLTRALLRNERAWADDAAGMASRHPAARTPQLRLAVQQARGVSNPAFLTRSEAAELIQQLDESDSDTRRTTLAGIRRQSADHLDLAIHDLQKAGLSAADHLGLLIGEDPAGAPLQRRVEALRDVTYKELGHAVDAGDVEAFDAVIAAGLNPYLESMRGAEQEQASLRRLELDYLALTRKLALSLAGEGVPPSRAAAAAVEQMIEARYVFNGGLRIARRFDAGLVSSHADRLLTDELLAFAPDPEATHIELDKGTSIAAWRKTLREEARFVTSPDDEGAVLVTAAGQPVRNADGEIFGFRFADAVPADTGREAIRRMLRQVSGTAGDMLAGR